MGSGPAPSRVTAAWATTTLLAAVLLGCGGGVGPSADAPTPAGTPPQRLCADLITHWAGVTLDAADGTDAVGLDYQAMGLSGDQYEILRAVLDGARAVRRDEGAPAARAFGAREAERRCAERYRSGAPTDGPWR
ncbi:hypothetical protein OHA84_10730 [Streptomyces sp. NBC_00513]|uniref:hypothetical protein n=1 Tax=unclassified Streptomyces TaxID=2593676 RepID=UPI00225516B0|nr:MULTISPECIES: hypothetical protein [unclassified Streptomyces]MCX5075980.1 hypothetical protein [Streptomyces sp. NBC_00424]MCX5152420.1 hypothetical protein [Streptomyces sp. NBC_00291]WUD40951.1 hypothetical protein OHA84_10730 [Streptomyces sp. NBC_00513]